MWNAPKECDRVCLSVCICVRRGHVYLPSPLFLLLPDRPFVLRHRLCTFAAIGFGCISSPSSTPPISCFSSVSSLLGNSGFCLGFGGGLVERRVLCEQRRRLPNTITGCFGPLHFTRSEGADLSQLRAGRAGCCPSHCDPPPSSLWSLARKKPRARTLYPLCAGSGRPGLSNYYNLVSTFLGNQTKRWQITSISFHLPTSELFSEVVLVRESRILYFIYWFWYTFVSQAAHCDVRKIVFAITWLVNPFNFVIFLKLLDMKEALSDYTVYKN